MKIQALFSSKDKSKKLKCHLLQFLFGTLTVNLNTLVLQLYIQRWQIVWTLIRLLMESEQICGPRSAFAMCCQNYQISLNTLPLYHFLTGFKVVICGKNKNLNKITKI